MIQSADSGITPEEVCQATLGSCSVLIWLFSAQSLRPLRLSGEQTFKYIHRRDAEAAEGAQRISNEDTTLDPVSAESIPSLPLYVINFRPFIIVMIVCATSSSGKRLVSNERW